MTLTRPDPARTKNQPDPARPGQKFGRFLALRGLAWPDSTRPELAWPNPSRPARNPGVPGLALPNFRNPSLAFLYLLEGRNTSARLYQSSAVPLGRLRTAHGPI